MLGDALAKHREDGFSLARFVNGFLHLDKALLLHARLAVCFRRVFLQPRVLERLVCGVPLVHVFSYQTLQKVFGLRRAVLEWLMVEVEVALDDVSNDLKLGVARERDLAREHYIKYNAH